MAFSFIRFDSSQYNLSKWRILKVIGKDREAFCQGQLTNDLSTIKTNEGQLSARLNRSGKLQSFFIVGKLKDCLWLICPKEIVLSVKEDLEKFVIMEDVSFEPIHEELWIWFNPFLSDVTIDETCPSIDLNFYGLPAKISFKQQANIKLCNPIKLEMLRILNGWPEWGHDLRPNQLINETMLNELAVSYKKGCFLGQETVTKIHNNRGAAYYPTLLKLTATQDLSAHIKKEFFIIVEKELQKGGEILYQVENYLVVTLFRDFRIMGKTWEVQLNDKIVSATVSSLPLYENQNRKTISLELYHLGIDSFHQNEYATALQYFEKALKFDPMNADAYEAIGVLLGRLEKFSEAINWMDKLLAVNPQSVMAHTNKSLYLMKLGRIEEAEKEKGLATVKSFSVFGKEAEEKRNQAEEEKRKERERNRREQMFRQVLELDPNDTIALYGMADIYYQKKEYLLASTNLEQVIALEKNYSTAYLLLGKTYEALGEKKKAQEIYIKGISIASKRGDLMPASEMQARLGMLS